MNKATNLHDVTVLATGESIQVYRHRLSEKYVKFGGIGSCSLTYEKSELKFAEVK